MNSLLYYYNNVQKMAAYRQAKRMQRGVLTAQGGFSTTDPALLQMPCTIQCVCKITQENDGIEPIFVMSNVIYGLKLTYQGNRLVFFISGDSKTIPVEIGKIYDIIFSLDFGQTTAYINNEPIITSDTPLNKLDIYNIGYNSGLYFKSEYLLHRHFNYAMSADEVKALDNNNDPMGYVVPKAKRAGLLAEYLPQNIMESRKGPEVEHTAETYEFNIGSPYSQTVVSGRQYPFDCIYRVDYVVDEWDFQPKVSRLIVFVGTSGASVIAGVKSWIRKSDAKIGEVQSCFIKMPNEGNPSILLYGDQDTEETTARHLKVTIKGITPVSVPISWLDSAKQMPLSDEYMDPLFQSIGGYDMAANGAPEILYNE
mgnify:CR=1 FL=1